MGYSVYSTETEIRVRAENVPSALDALRPLFRRDENDLVDAFEQLGWRAELDDDGNLVDLVLVCGRFDECERRVLQALVPFVEGTAVLKLIGEDRAQWAVVIERNAETGKSEMREEEVVLVLASEVEALELAGFVCGV